MPRTKNYPREFGFLPVKDEAIAKKDYDRRRGQRRRKIALRASAAAIAAVTGISILANHVAHDRAEGVMEQLDQKHTDERKALALPYRDPEVVRATDTHRVVNGRDTFHLTLSLPPTAKAAEIRQAAISRRRANLPPIIDWLSPAGAVLVPVGHNAEGKPIVNHPRFMEAFQGRNAGVQIDERWDDGIVDVTLPAGHVKPGDTRALYIDNSSTSDRFPANNNAKEQHNNVLSETEGDTYLGSFTYEVGQEGHPGHWQYYPKGSPDAPQLPDELHIINRHAPPGATL